MKPINTILLIIAIIILLINITLTILEAIRYYHLTYHPGRIRGASGAHSIPAGRVRIGGMWYNVRWIIVGREGIIKLEESEDFIYADTESVKSR